MGGYIGSKAVSLSTTSADVTGDADIGGDLTVDTNTLHVDSTNNAVGIGNAAPTHNLHVTDTGTPNLIIESTAGSSADAKLRIRGSRTTSVVGDLCQILFETNDSDAAGDTLGFITAGKDVASTNRGVIRFGTTTTDGGSPSEHMRLTSGGKIGLGYTNPDEKLGVNGFLGLVGSNGTTPPSNNPSITRVNSSNDMAFFTGGSERARIYGNGKFTVGTHDNLEVNHDPSASLSAVYIRSGEGVNGGSSSDLSSGTQLLSIHGDSDALQVRNIATGDYSIVNSQQANGIAIYDGTGGLGFFYNNSEKAEVTSSGFSTVSDERLKDQQGDIDVDAISVFNSLNLFKYHPKAHADDASGDTDTMMYGFSAQQLNQLAPHAVNDGVDDLSDDPKKPWYSVSDTSLKALMIQAIKTLSAENEAMKARLDALEAN